MYRKVKPQQALIREGVGGVVVSFSGVWVLPIVHRAQAMDMSSKTIAISRKGAQGLSCKDCIRADCECAFHVRVLSSPLCFRRRFSRRAKLFIQNSLAFSLRCPRLVLVHRWCTKRAPGGVRWPSRAGANRADIG